MKRLLPLMALVSMTACASNPDKMTASYVSPVIYEDYSCSQLAAEAQRVNRRANELYGTLKQDADNDSAQMAIGLILFWPTLFFLEGGDGPQAAEYQRLKGERDAIEQVSIQKKCGIQFEEFQAEKDARKQETSKPKTTNNFNKHEE